MRRRTICAGLCRNCMTVFDAKRESIYITESLALLVEVGNVELEVYTQLMAYLLLLKTSTSILLAKKHGDYVYLMLREFVSAHVVRIIFCKNTKILP